MKYFAFLAMLVMFIPATSLAADESSIASLQNEIISLEAQLVRLNNAIDNPAVPVTVKVDGVAVVDGTITTSPLQAFQLCTVYGVNAPEVDIEVQCDYGENTFFYAAY